MRRGTCQKAHTRPRPSFETELACALHAFLACRRRAAVQQELDGKVQTRTATGSEFVHSRRVTVRSLTHMIGIPRLSDCARETDLLHWFRDRPCVSVTGK